jgi:hypothetical protein
MIENSGHIMGLQEPVAHTDINDLTVFSGVKPVKEPLTHNGYRVKGKYAIVNKCNNSVLGVVGDKHLLTNHYDVFKTSTTNLTGNGINLSNVKIFDRLFNDGSRATRTIVFNDEVVNIGLRDRDEKINFRIDLINSIDGSLKWQNHCGGYNSFCLNEQVFITDKKSGIGERVIQTYFYTRKHTSGLNINASSQKVANATNLLKDNAERLKRWKDTPVEPKHFYALVEKTLALRSSGSKSYDKIGKPIIAQSTLAYIMKLYDDEAKHIGHNLFACYQALTHYLTHIKDNTFTKRVKDGSIKELTLTRGGDELNIKNARRKEVVRALNSDYWLYIVSNDTDNIKNVLLSK